MRLHDETFVESAYWTLLGRPADPEGLVHYRTHLRRGVSKAQLLWELRHSREGNSHTARLDGLEQLLRRHRRTRWLVVGPLFALLTGAESQGRRARQKRAIVNAIWAVEQELGQRIDRLEARVEALAAYGSDPANRARSSSIMPDSGIMTRRARDLLTRLKATMASAAKEG